MSLFSFSLSGPPKTEAQLKKEAKKREKLEKFQQKKEMEAKKKTQPPTEVYIYNSYKYNLFDQYFKNINVAFINNIDHIFAKLFIKLHVSTCALLFSLLEKGQARKEGVGSGRIQYPHCPWGEKRCVSMWVESSSSHRMLRHDKA